jgi:hypothetical protein
MQVGDILDSLESDRLKIVETGCANTRAIALWVSRHPESLYATADLDSFAQWHAHQELEQDGTARFCTFLTQDHTKFLSNRTWVDVAFLQAPNLQDGLTEFLLTTSTGARVIVMTGYQSRAAHAIRRAKEIGWTYESAGDLNILRRPEE